MAAVAVTTLTPNEAALRAFAQAAGQLLVERRARGAGARSLRNRSGVGIEVLDHRDYVPGDEIRHIDWRQTRRQRRPIVRRFEAETVADWTLLLDASSSMATGGAAKWQAALTAAAAMSYALLDLGHRVGVLVFGDKLLTDIPAGRGAHHFAALVRRLADHRLAVSGEGSRPGVCAARLRGHASVFVISDFLADDEMRRDLAGLRERCAKLHVLQLVDDGDVGVDGPGGGDVDLVDAETGARRSIRADPSARVAAITERAAMTARLRDYCLRTRVAYSAWNLTMPWQPALLEHLVAARRLC